MLYTNNSVDSIASDILVHEAELLIKQKRLIYFTHEKKKKEKKKVYQNSHFFPDIQGIYSQYFVLCGETPSTGRIQKREQHKK